LKNSPAIAQNFDTLKNRFNKLYQVKAMLHHYTQIVDSTVFEDAINDLEGVIECYKNADLNAPNFHVQSQKEEYASKAHVLGLY